MTWEKFGKGIFGFAVFVAGIVLKGWVLTILWVWFVASKFDLPVLAIPEAIGLALIIRYLTVEHNVMRDTKSYGEQVIAAFAFPLIVLGVGWLTHSFMLVVGG